MEIWMSQIRGLISGLIMRCKFSFVYNLVDLYTTYFPPSMLFCATTTFDHTIGSATQALMHWIIFRIKEKGSI